jgi:outer membrane protein assembly factor BamB
MAMCGGMLIAAAEQNQPAQTPAAPRNTFERLWNHTIDAPGQLGIAASPQRVFITDDETGVEARAVTDGATAWQQALPSDLPVAVAGDQVYVASAGQIHALDEATGRVRWARPLGAQAVALIAQSSGALTAAGPTVRAWSADGTALWDRALGANVVRELLAVDSSQVYVGLTDYTLVALDLASGAVKWTERLGTLPSAFAVAGGRLFFGGTDRNLHAYNRDGGRAWMYHKEEVVGAPAVDGEYVYAALSDNTIVAHDRGNGHLKWRRPLENRPARGPMLSGPHVVSILRSDVVIVMPRTADKPGTAPPAPAPPPLASPTSPATTESTRNRVWVATPSADGTQVFAVIQLENGVRVVVAYKRT